MILTPLEINPASPHARRLSQPPRVLLFSGHSGGHLFPAVAFAEKLIEKYPDCLVELVTSVKARGILESAGHPFAQVTYLPSFPFPGKKIGQFLPFLWKLSHASFLSLRKVLGFKPVLCVGFGSYASYPGMILSSKINIPTMIHEQNAVFGEASRRLLKHVKAIALTFPPDSPPVNGKRFEVVGLPLRRALIAKSPSHRKERGDSFVILATGGSQGSHQLNILISEALCSISDEEKKKIAVIHITGTKDADWVLDKYRQFGVQAKVQAFTSKMHELYVEADMAISRGGANTLFELAHFKLPAIVIPYPYASSHQSDNVKYFESRGGVFSREEKDTSPGWLLSQIRLLLNDASSVRLMADRLSQISTPQAADRLVFLAEQLICGDIPS